MNENEDRHKPKMALRFFSLGDVISFVTALIMIGILWGRISTELNNMHAEIAEINSQALDKRVALLEQRNIILDEKLRDFHSDLLLLNTQMNANFDKIDKRLDKR